MTLPALPPFPTVVLWPDESPAGVVYLPGNKLAEVLCELMGVAAIKPHKLPVIEALGFRVVRHNGFELPRPSQLTAYRRRPAADPRHVLDEA